MTALNHSTRRRLQKLRQVPSVWEGDRRLLSPDLALRTEFGGGRMQGQCILWVDGTEGIVRAMDMVPPETGHEAIVRALLQAMEHPQSPSPPARPQKIVVRDREIQFFLRGVLQDLDIVVDYVPELPLIDEIFYGLQGIARSRPPQLPPELVAPILSAAEDIWHDAPWETLDEEKVIAVELNYGDVETLYVSILGMLGMEYGLLMYRSLDSLKQFRQRVLVAGDAPDDLEGAFLEQDCLFITYEQSGVEAETELTEEDEELQAFYDRHGVCPTFGNLHPLEGMRPALYEEEASTALIALQALHRFFHQHLAKMDLETFPQLTSRYRIVDPKNDSKRVAVKVSTLPDLADELAEMSMELGLAEEMPNGNLPMLRNDLIPENAFYSLGAMSWEILTLLQTNVKFRQEAEIDFPHTADGFPVILIQTSQVKANAMIKEFKSAGGLKAICFNPGEDPFSEEHYDLGILQMQNGDIHLFGEFIEDDPTHIQARKKWDQRCKKTRGYCGLVIAKGLRGSSKGNPKIDDMLALFEVRSISSKDLGLGPLQLMPLME